MIKPDATDTMDMPDGLGALSRQKKRMTMAGVLLAMFLASMDHTVVATAMPRIIADLGGFGQYTLISSVYIIASAIAMPIAGRLTDMYGRKPFYIAGLVIFIASSLGCGLSRTLFQLLVWRGVKGVGGGVMMATGFTVIGDLFPPAQRGKYIGVGSAIFGFAAIVGPLMGGFITDHFSWPWVFYVNIPLGVVVVFLFLRFFPHLRPDLIPHRIDFAGIIALILTILSFVLALSWVGGKYPWHSARMIGIFAFTAAMLVLFLWIESVSQEPILPLELFGNGIVVISLSVLFLSGFCMYGSWVFIPLFFQGVLGDSATASGSILTPMMLGAIAGSFLSGRLLSRSGGHYRMQGAVGISIMALGMWLLSRMDGGIHATHALMIVALTGFGVGITLPLYTLAIQNAVPYSRLGVATSSAPFFRSLGGACGLAVLGAVMHRQFTLEVSQKLAEQMKAVIHPDRLIEIANNPQILVDAAQQKQLGAALSEAVSHSAGIDLLPQLLHGLRHCLEAALSRTFFVALLAILLAFLIHLFIKEVPLRQDHLL